MHVSFPEAGQLFQVPYSVLISQLHLCLAHRSHSDGMVHLSTTKRTVWSIIVNNIQPFKDEVRRPLSGGQSGRGGTVRPLAEPASLREKETC